MVFLKPENVCVCLNSEFMPTISEDNRLKQFPRYILNTRVFYFLTFLEIFGHQLPQHELMDK